MANIIALSDVCKYARVTIDSSVNKSIFMHHKDGHVVEFRQFKSGLYYCNVAEQNNKLIRTNKGAVQYNFNSSISYNYFPYLSLVQTVA